MSGVPNPQYPITEPFGAAAQPEYIVLPIPIPDQTLIEPGAASYDTGFAPINMTDLAAGGIPPRGKDMNGILYSITQYCALMQAGQIVPFDAAVAAAIAGYKVGAKVASTTPGIIWVNNVDGNQTDPDSGGAAGWGLEGGGAMLFQGFAPPAGTINNLALLGASDYAIDVSTAAGDVVITGIVPQRNGQRVLLSNIGVNLLTVSVLDAGSAGNNQIRGPSSLSMVQNQSMAIQWVQGPNKWLLT